MRGCVGGVEASQDGTAVSVEARAMKRYPDPPASGKWRVRRWPGTKFASIWEVFEPNGEFSGAFETWPEAIDWATSIATRVEYFLLECGRRPQ